MVSCHFAGRSTLHTSATFSDRLKAVHAILTKGGYAGGPWTRGRRSLVTDMCQRLKNPNLRSRGILASDASTVI